MPLSLYDRGHTGAVPVAARVQYVVAGFGIAVSLLMEALADV